MSESVDVLPNHLVAYPTMYEKMEKELGEERRKRFKFTLITNKALVFKMSLIYWVDTTTIATA